MTKLLNHFAAMQTMCAAYVCPEPYTSMAPGCTPCSHVEGDSAARDNLFISDMIYMLDGPEQREAQAEKVGPLLGLATTKQLRDELAARESMGHTHDDYYTSMPDEAYQALGEQPKTFAQKLRDVHGVAMSPGNAHATHYMRGMGNGLELALCILDDREPAYIEADVVRPYVLGELSRDIHQRNVDAGWWTDLATGERKDRNVGELLMLVVSEVAEAMEGHRKSLPDDKLPHRSMFEVELADVFIRIFDIAGAHNLDLDGAVAEKLAYNAQREDHKIETRKGVGGKAY